jgi:hypothetical protein
VLGLSRGEAQDEHVHLMVSLDNEELEELKAEWKVDENTDFADGQ